MMSLHRFSLIVALACFPLLTGFSLFGSKYDDANRLYEEGKYGEALEIYLSDQDNRNVDVRAAIRYRLGEMYLDGKGTAPDAAKAFSYFEGVAGGESRTWKIIALDQIARMYRDGIGVTPSQTKALAIYEVLTNSGDPAVAARSHWYMGDILSKASDSPIQEERARAADAFRKCLKLQPRNKGCGASLDLLSEYPDIYIYLHPEEFTQQEAGLAPGGMTQAYKLFSEGDFGSAFKIIKWHARNGNAEAQLEVARQHLNGVGIPRNQEVASGWMFLAAKNGNSLAQKEYGTAISFGQVWGSFSDALFWLDASAQQGNGDAFNEMGRIWLNPIDETKKAKPDPRKAFELISKAAELGSLVAVTNLGRMYLNGIGVSQDKEVAKQLFLKAAA